ncbi:hypothetical protein VE03_00109 [Pseudogymnoascus sp. 23342-1-I1]|nr:hypothetical protein VE03_00109 [Pseudogymnoascus sp. 23342-1-I1]
MTTSAGANIYVRRRGLSRAHGRKFLRHPTPRLGLYLHIQMSLLYTCSLDNLSAKPPIKLDKMVSKDSVNGDIHDVWGYKYKWTDLHWTEEQQLPLEYLYDTLGEDVLAHVKDLQMKKAVENGGAPGKGAPRKTDLYESLKSIALSKEDPVVTKF